MVKRHLRVLGFTFVGLCLTMAPAFGQALNIADDFSADPTASGTWLFANINPGQGAHGAATQAVWIPPGTDKCDDGMGNFAPQDCRSNTRNGVPNCATDINAGASGCFCSLYSADDWTDVGADPATAGYVRMTGGLGQRSALYYAEANNFSDFEVTATVEATQGCRYDSPADGMGVGIWEMGNGPNTIDTDGDTVADTNIATSVGQGGGGNGLSGIVCEPGGGCELTDGDGDTVEDGGQTIAFEVDTNGSNFGDQGNRNHVMVAYSRTGFPKVDSLPIDNAVVVIFPDEIKLHNQIGPADHEANRFRFKAQFKNGVAAMQANFLDQGVDFGQILELVLDGYTPFSGIVGATGASGGRDQHSILHDIDISGPLGDCDLIGPVVDVSRSFSGLRRVECGDVVAGDTINVSLAAAGDVRDVMGCANGDLTITEVLPIGWTASNVGDGTIVAGDAMAGESDQVTWSVAAADAGSFSASYNLTVAPDFDGGAFVTGSITEIGGTATFGTDGESRLASVGGFQNCAGIACWNIIGPISNNACDFVCMPSLAEMRADYLADGNGNGEANLNWGPGVQVTPDFNGASPATGILASLPHTGNSDSNGDGILDTLNVFAWKDGNNAIDLNNDVFGLNPDNAMAYAQAYVTNTTGAPLSVVIVMDAGKSTQVLLNGTEVLIDNNCPSSTGCRPDTNNGTCRTDGRRKMGTIRPSTSDDPGAVPTPGYDETQPIILQPGVNSVVVKVWCGQGSRSVFNFWFGFRDSNAGDANYIGAPDLEISLATGVGLLPGDNNGDGSINIADAVTILNFLFGGGDLPGCLLEGPGELAEIGVIVLDFNGDGGANISDAIGSLNNLFAGGPEHTFGSECRLFQAGTCDENCTVN